MKMNPNSKKLLQDVMKRAEENKSKRTEFNDGYDSGLEQGMFIQEEKDKELIYRLVKRLVG